MEARRQFATTLHYPLRARWASRARFLTADAPSAGARVRRVLAAIHRGEPVVLNGFDAADLAAAAIAARLHLGAGRTSRRPAPIIITDCTWSTGSGMVDRRRTKAAVSALRSPRTWYTVGTDAEAAAFPQTWGVPADRVLVTHWYHGLTDAQVTEPVRHDGPIFAGGRSVRDYRALLTVAARTGLRITLSAAERYLPPGVPIPAGVTVGELSPPEYHAAMRDAACVVVPVQDRPDRAAGQSSYLNAMALGKLVVVTDTLGVAEHIEDGVTGLLVRPGDADDLQRALEWALDPANDQAVSQIREAARESALRRFAPDHHIEELLVAVDSATSADHPTQPL